MTTTIEPPADSPAEDQWAVSVSGSSRPTARRAGRPASNLLTVNVTEQHILKGEPGNPEKCPVAFALVDAAEAESNFRKGSLIFQDWVMERIDAYDRGEGMEPFTFVAEPSF